MQPSSEWFLVGTGAYAAFLRVVPGRHWCLCSLPQCGSRYALVPIQPSSEWFLVGIGAYAAFLRVVPGRHWLPMQPSSEWFLVGIGAYAALPQSGSR